MSKYKGLFTFDVDNHRYLPVEQADGIIDCMNYHPELEMPKEPLIKDKRIRRSVYNWAKVNSIFYVIYSEIKDRSQCCLTDTSEEDFTIQFVGWIPTLKDGLIYNIFDLCGVNNETSQ